MDLKSLKIGVVGAGVVGNAVLRGFMEHVQFTGAYDLDPMKGDCSCQMLMRECDVVFVCVPTASTPNGRLDTGVVLDVLHGLREGLELSSRSNDDPPAIAIKSTLNPGDTQRLADEVNLPICFNPEFLTARCAAVDFCCPTRNIVGIPHMTENDRWRQKRAMTVVQLFHHRFPGVPCYCIDAMEAETIKLAQNAFFSTKVGFFHTLLEYCENESLDFETIRECLVTDGRIHPSHTIQPGHDGKVGFGGTCLPKDTIAYARALECDWLESMWQRNDAIRPEELLKAGGS